MHSDDLGAQLYATLGLEGLRGHPAFDKLIEEERQSQQFADRERERWHGMHESDRGHYEVVANTLYAVQEHISIGVICFTNAYAERFHGLLREDFHWHKVDANRLGHARADVRLILERTIRDGVGLRGQRFDYIAPHRDTSWQVMEAVYPTASRILRY